MKTVFALLFVLLVLPAAAWGTGEANEPVWWGDALAQAQQDGYVLGGHEVLAPEGQAPEGALLIDVRPDYEFAAGHIPGAENLEFDLGDRRQLSPEKEEGLLALAGGDKDRPLIFYCRSFR